MSKRPLEEVVPSGLTVESVLMNDPDIKSTFVLCTDKTSGEKAVVVLAKKAWTEPAVRRVLTTSDTALHEFHRNDKFSKYTAIPATTQTLGNANEVDITLICPANEIDIAKYSQQERHLVRETPEIYAQATLPFVAALPPKQTAWVRAILDREKEMEVLLYEDDGCMLLPDTKWDRKDASALYTLAILKDPALKSVRDLRGAHVPMLKQLRAGVLAELGRRYGARADQVRAYMHYLPSFWMAHIHFSVLTCPALGASTSVGKAILLDDIIDWLERDPEHFATANLTFAVGERDPLFAKLEEAGFVTKV